MKEYRRPEALSVGKVIGREEVLADPDEVALLEDGTLVVDYDLVKCHDGVGHSGCVATFTVSPCGCVHRRTTHYVYSEHGEFEKCYTEPDSELTYRFARCGEDCEAEKRAAKRVEKTVDRGDFF